MYGDKTQEVADIYLSRARAFANLKKYDSFHKDLLSALKIYKSLSKNYNKVAECNFLLGKIKCLEGSINEGI
jgi:hypothetical protein